MDQQKPKPFPLIDSTIQAEILAFEVGVETELSKHPRIEPSEVEREVDFDIWKALQENVI